MLRGILINCSTFDFHLVFLSNLFIRLWLSVGEFLALRLPGFTLSLLVWCFHGPGSLCREAKKTIHTDLAPFISSHLEQMWVSFSFGWGGGGGGGRWGMERKAPDYYISWGKCWFSVRACEALLKKIFFFACLRLHNWIPTYFQGISLKHWIPMSNNRNTFVWFPHQRFPQRPTAKASQKM